MDKYFSFKSSNLNHHSFTHNCPFYSLYEVNHNFPNNIITSAFPGRARGESLMVCSALVLIDFIIELVKRIAIETMSTAGRSMLRIPLPTFVLVNQNLIGSNLE